ncbi:unnamed protein product [Prorocentrum cordatum]|uniref:Uncharacterized protein n=1 Tax=Prorocentrum cordatum TaxID=2364126 RepID=A0ABN9XQ21_9DINO|nr:unnamed protein product [Polarella glacialis]
MFGGHHRAAPTPVGAAPCGAPAGNTLIYQCCPRPGRPSAGAKETLGRRRRHRAFRRRPRAVRPLLHPLLLSSRSGPRSDPLQEPRRAAAPAKAGAARLALPSPVPPRPCPAYRRCSAEAPFRRGPVPPRPCSASGL